MSTRPIPTPPKRGRPRSGRTEKAILQAASELVATSGLADMTIEGVADRAGVGKASIYRRWPSKGALAFDAVVDTILSTQPTPDTGSFEGDLLQVARTWIGGARGRRGGRTVAGLIAEVQSDPEVIMDLFYGPLYHRYLNGHLPLDDAFAKRVARMVAAAAADGAAA